MKTKNVKISIGVAVVLFALSWNASGNDSFLSIKERTHNICHTVKQKTLLEVADQVAKLSGIRFKVSPALEGDEINQRLAADDWNEALAQLLQGYNYTTISDRQVIKTVLITGRNGSGLNTVPVSDADVGTSMVEVTNIPSGNELALNSPIGQSKVNWDDDAGNNDDDSTSIGYFDQNSKGYKVYLSQVDAGAMEAYFSDGTYNIEMPAGQAFDTASLQ